ncbi:response regulator transcription factor [Chitiniphilus eburneus]|uniref:Response regulator transcription factor n=1 Tax=Chitiniphilus eburneus TaxID=2571148 RepID=A0A4U0QBR6_9NEIS|nr:response regulator transcription factor [Chitiniphilus eburneus]TJZ78815.1 response regulator transcription factor [Chitiniphilus eburneus]
MRILIVEDDAEIAGNLYDYLVARGHQVDAAPNGLVGLHLASSHPFDAMVLDLGLPGMDGLSLAQRLRRDAHSPLPILMLTARDTLDDKVAGFDAGADDYLVKPFALREVEMRLRALVKRAQGRVVDQTLQVGALEYDALSGEVRWQGRELALPPKSLRLLAILMAQPGRLLSRAELEAAVWGEEQERSDALRTQIAQLRRALTLPDGRCPLLTIHGRGYKLVALDDPASIMGAP